MAAAGENLGEPTAAPVAPLDGVRVLDLTSVIMGPLATRILADLGADVIKIEPPEGEMLRSADGARISPMMLNLYRNKRSVVLDLKTPAGRGALEALIPTADVFVHNLRPKVIARLGFTYASVRELNPNIIYCAACGFGRDGPYADKPAYDDLIQAASGYASTATPLTGKPGYAPAIICDKVAGQAVAQAILAGLLHRERGAGGQAIEVPMFETAIDFNLVEGFGGLVYDPPRGPPGYSRLETPERRPCRTADGFACILPYTAQNWSDFLDFVGRSNWKDRVGSAEVRLANIDDLYRLVHLEAPKRTTAEWLSFCDAVDIPCMPVLDAVDLTDDPHVRAVGLMDLAQHPSEGSYRALRPPARFSGWGYHLRHHAPALGAHTEEVLASMGLPPPAARHSG